jgi:hypothetical protein
VKITVGSRLAVPGEPLDVEVVLASGAETPVDFVDVRFEGRERVQYGKYDRSESVFTVACRHGPRVLGVGTYRLPTRFELPATLTPTYRGTTVSIGYTIGVHVSIPWWPDRREEYAIVVPPLPADVAPPAPKTFVSTLAGAKGTTPFLELSLESTTLNVGGPVAGAASVTNTREAGARGVDLFLVGTETSAVGRHEAARVRWHLHDGAPEEGKALAFRSQVWSRLWPTITAQLFALTWHLELVVDRAWHFDETLFVPVTIRGSAAGGGRPAGVAASVFAPVGSERRAIAWATVAERHGLANDGARERMTASIGAASLALELQTRGGDGLHGVAAVRWPDLGMDLDVAPRGLGDLLAREVPFADGEGTKVLRVRCREHAQARALFEAGLLDELAAFSHVHLDDEGATFDAPVGYATVAQLDAFVTQAIAATRALAYGIARIPAPAAMAPFAPAWERFAAQAGGRFATSAMRVSGIPLGSEAGEVATLWSRRGEIEGTRLRVPLSPPLDAPFDATSATSQRAREIAAVITRGARDTRFGPEALEALVDGPLEDPAAVMPLVEGLGELARALRAGADAGPYR